MPELAPFKNIVIPETLSPEVVQHAGALLTTLNQMETSIVSGQDPDLAGAAAWLGDSVDKWDGLSAVRDSLAAEHDLLSHTSEMPVDFFRVELRQHLLESIASLKITEARPTVEPTIHDGTAAAVSEHAASISTMLGQMEADIVAGNNPKLVEAAAWLGDSAEKWDGTVIMRNTLAAQHELLGQTSEMPQDFMHVSLQQNLLETVWDIRNLNGQLALQNEPVEN